MQEDGVEATFSQYAALEPSARRLARVLAHFHYTPIPRLLLRELGHWFSAEDLQSLQSAGFLDTDGIEAHEIGIMEPELAKLLRAESVGRVDRNKAFEVLQSLCTEEACMDPGRWPLIQTIESHIRGWWEHLEIADEGDVRLPLRLVPYWESLEAYELKIWFEKRCAEKTEHSLGPDHPDTLFARAFVARSMSENPDLVGDAIEILQDALEKSTENLGPNHKDTLFLMHSLGAVLAEDPGAQEDAAGLLERTLDLQNSSIGQESRGSLTTRQSLALLTAQMGNLEDARHILHEVQEVLERVYGPSDIQTLTVMDNLAVLYAEDDHLEKARAIMEDALKRRRQPGGAVSADLCGALQDLAAICADLEDDDAELAYVNETLEVARVVFGQHSPEALGAMSQLAELYSVTGDLDRAESIAREVMEIGKREFEEDNCGVLRSVHELAVILLEADREEEAEELWASLEWLLQGNPEDLPSDEHRELREELEEVF